MKLILSNRSFVSNVVKLMTGTIIAQAIQLAAAPILSRLYSPSDFGVFALYLSVTSLLSIIATARYEMAIMLPSSQDDAVNILALAVSISFILSLASLGVVFLFNKQIATLLGAPGISGWLYFIPISIFFSGLYQSFNYWTNRAKDYRRISVSKVVQFSSSSAVNVAMGLGGWGVGGLIGGNASGLIIAACYLGKNLLGDIKGYLRSITKERMAFNARRYQSFPVVNTLHAFSDTLQASAVNFLIAFYFGSQLLGFYAFTFRILRAPLGIIGSSLSQVFFQRASEAYNNQQPIAPLVRRMVLVLSAVALPIFILLYLYSPDIFVAIFGVQWREAGIYARILSPWLYFNFIVSPLAQIAIIVNRQKEMFYLGVLGNLLIVLSIIYGGLVAKDIKSGFIVLSLTESVYLLFLINWIYRVAGTRRDYR